MNGREAHNIGRGNVHKLNFRSMNGSEAHKMLDSEVYLCFVLTNVAGPVSRRESSERSINGSINSRHSPLSTNIILEHKLNKREILVLQYFFSFQDVFSTT